MRVPGFVFMAVAMVVLFTWSGTGVAGPHILKVEMDGDGDGNGPNVDLIVREVRVTPIVAHTGDTIRFVMVLENHGDPAKKTIPINILANGKVVATQLFRFGYSGPPLKRYRETFMWDTKGVSPGEYRIEGEAFVWEDTSPFDNSLKVKEPLVLLPAGAALPEGREDGGTAVAEY